MSSAAPTTAPARTFRLRQIALPTEHGAWGFLLEPLVGGLAIAFSAAGVWIALIVIGAFLARRPLQVFVAQWDKQGSEVGTAAWRFFCLYTLVAIAGLAGVLLTSGTASLIPFVLVTPLAAYQLYTEIAQRGRQLIAEVSGAVVMPVSAAALVLAAGGTWPAAVAIWLLFVARFVPSILYVRNRLDLEKGKHSSALIPAVAHLIALIGVSWLAVTDRLPFLTVVAFIVLLARSLFGLSPYRRRVKAMKIGIWEVIYGLLTVTSLIVGHYAGI